MFSRNVYHVFGKQWQLQARNYSETVGFIGIGNMGTRMANNLTKKGHKLKVYDPLPGAAETVKGATVCKSPLEAATDTPVIITMLPDGGVVKNVLLGEQGLFNNVKKNTLLVDCSTIEPKTAKELNEQSVKYGVKFLDAPVSGGVKGAAEATLTFMVGGNKQYMEEVQDLLKHMGARVVHCGGPGSGQSAKLCNNLILAISMIGVSEGMNLGRKLGLDLKVLSDIVNTSTGRCWSSDTNSPVPGLTPNVPSNINYEGGFQCKLVAKDLALAQAAAVEVGAPLPLTANAHQIYRTMMSHGFSNRDFASVYKYLRGERFE